MIGHEKKIAIMCSSFHNSIVEEMNKVFQSGDYFPAQQKWDLKGKDIFMIIIHPTWQPDSKNRKLINDFIKKHNIPVGEWKFKAL